MSRKLWWTALISAWILAMAFAAACSKGPAKAHHARTIDLKALVRDLRLEDGRLRFSLASDGQVWARPGEVLEAVGLDARADLARLVRTNVQYDL